MRHAGGEMAVETGLLEFTKTKPSATRSVTFREDGKEHADLNLSRI